MAVAWPWLSRSDAALAAALAPKPRTVHNASAMAGSAKHTPARTWRRRLTSMPL